MKLLVATHNAHKTAEFAAILGPLIEVSDLTSLPHLQPPEETGRTFAANAALKAVAVSRATSLLVVADDSGLEVDALQGAPGVYSARYSGVTASDEQNVSKLLAELRRVKLNSEATARFCCALSVACAGEEIAVFYGTVEGTIIASPRGRLGFGYDPVFVPKGYTLTFAELGDAVKNTISHRARALAQLLIYLQSKRVLHETEADV